MRKLLSALFVAALVLASGCASVSSQRQAGKMTKPTVVEAACGQCQFGLKEKKGCDLAVRRDGQSYFVDGFALRQFGNPDADGGMCQVIRKAKVTGEIVHGRLAAASLELLPVETK